MELGVFSLSGIYPDGLDTAQSRTGDIIGYGTLAERHGLDVFGSGEHHPRAFAVAPPAVVHAAIANATSRIRLTTAATVLSVLDPVRVFQDFATLDLVSSGRAEIIAGRSAFAESSAPRSASTGSSAKSTSAACPPTWSASIKRFGDTVAPAVRHVFTSERTSL